MQIINAPDLQHAEFQLLMDAMPAGAQIRQRFWLKMYRKHAKTLWQHNRAELMADWVVYSPCTRPQIWWVMEFQRRHDLPFEIGDLGAWAIWPQMVPAVEIQQRILMKHGCVYL